MQREVTTMEKVIVRLTALDFVTRDVNKDFDSAFCQVTGWINEHAKCDPGTAYTIEEVAKLFDILFNMYQGRAEGSEGNGK